jgi:suppressor of tumorigenicity protein 13
LVIADTLTEIRGVLDKHPAVLVEFGAVWCMPCQKFLPQFKRFAAKYPNIVCVKVDVDVDPAVVSEYKLQSVPQIMWFVNGQLDRVLPADVRSVPRLEQELNL